MTTILGYVEPGYLVIEMPEIIKAEAVAATKSELFIPDNAKKRLEKENASKIEDALNEAFKKQGAFVLQHNPSRANDNKTGKVVFLRTPIISEDFILPAMKDGEKVLLECIVMHESNVSFTCE